jgi:Tfp pilus assembly protein PilN
MRPVNLLPQRYQRARATGQRGGIGYAAIGVLAALLVMTVLYLVTTNAITDSHEKTAKANAEQQAADARAGQLHAYGDFASLKASREAAVEGAAESRFDYERLMREVALVLPHNTYLTNFAATTSGAAAAASGAPTSTATPAAAGAADSSGPSLTISGCAPSQQGVATAVVRLRQLHNVTDVNLANSTKAGTSGSPGGSSGPTPGAGCKFAFAATVAFQAEAPQTTQQPVPARLGGGQ